MISRAEAALGALLKLAPMLVLGGLNTGCGRLLWDGDAPPIITSVAGEVDVIGLIRVGGDDELYLADFAGEGLDEKWRAGPFGSYSQAFESTFYLTIGTHVLLADFQGKVEVFDIADGRQTASVQLSDRATVVCPPPDESAQIWIGTQAGQGEVINLSTGASESVAAAPWFCAPMVPEYAQAPQVASVPPLATAAMFSASYALAQGDDAVAVGFGAFDSPTVVGYDPSIHKVRWEAPMTSGDPSLATGYGSITLYDGQLAAIYTVQKDSSTESHLTLFDAKTGARSWDKVLSTDAGELLMTRTAIVPNEVVLADASALTIFDLKTGDQKGVVGFW